jgi:predicted nucleic acid-binding protein
MSDMSGKTSAKIYWDSCVFLAWIQEEKPPKRKLADMEGISRAIQMAARGEAVIFTSVITHTEVLASKMETKAKKRYEDVFERPEVIEIGVDHPIAILASEIRDFYIGARDNLPEDQRKKALTVSTPDALHLATAILYGAEEFHTFDGDDPARADGLLRLGDKVATYDLKVKKPDDREEPPPLLAPLTVETIKQVTAPPIKAIASSAAEIAASPSLPTTEKK